MGQTLSEPVTNKITTSQQNEKMFVASSSMQGWRMNMEDAHTHLLKWGPGDNECSFFAVYDGHGGAAVAEYAGAELHQKLVKQPEYLANDIEAALRNTFLGIDEDMLNDKWLREELAGSTSIVVVIKDDTIYIANLGDSRAVACWNGRCDALSQDHKPTNELEAKRITAAGGWVEFNRVNGNLALSRALGDFVFKRNEKKSVEEQVVIALPDIETRKFSEDLEFLLLACDGIWDVLTNEEVVDFVRTRIAEKMDPGMICEELMTRCLAPDSQMGGLGCDNMTVVLVCFLHDKPYEHLASRCAIAPTLNRPRRTSTDSSTGSSPNTSCSNSTTESSDEETIINHLENSEKIIKQEMADTENVSSGENSISTDLKAEPELEHSISNETKQEPIKEVLSESDNAK